MRPRSRKFHDEQGQMISDIPWREYHQMRLVYTRRRVYDEPRRI